MTNQSCWARRGALVKLHNNTLKIKQQSEWNTTKRATKRATVERNRSGTEAHFVWVTRCSSNIILFSVFCFLFLLVSTLRCDANDKMKQKCNLVVPLEFPCFSLSHRTVNLLHTIIYYKFGLRVIIIYCKYNCTYNLFVVVVFSGHRTQLATHCIV